MARRKIVLVIVEGPSDDTALGVALKNVYDRNSVYIHIMHGDITSQRGITAQNIVANVGNAVKQYAESRHYKKSDFRQIIHIADMDGACIPDSCVIENSSLNGEVRYESDGIYTTKVQNIISRNQIKRGNLYRLRTQNIIWGIPYSIYYMSCNLDHVLYDKRNSTDDEKENNAYAFAKRYKNDRDGFIKFICESAFSVTDDFAASWEFIEKEMNSIERHTNLCIAIREELDSLQY